jgi:hypothetical protein
MTPYGSKDHEDHKWVIREDRERGEIRCRLERNPSLSYNMQGTGNLRLPPEALR